MMTLSPDRTRNITPGTHHWLVHTSELQSASATDPSKGPASPRPTLQPFFINAGLGLLGIVLFGLGVFCVATASVTLLILGSTLDIHVVAILIAFMVLGLFCLAASLFIRQRLTITRDPSSSTVLALYVGIEFLAGAFLVYVGIGNLVTNSGGPLGMIAIAVLGALLIFDCVLLYRREFKSPSSKPE